MFVPGIPGSLEAQELIHADGLIVAFRQHAAGDLAFRKRLADKDFLTTTKTSRKKDQVGLASIARIRMYGRLMLT